MYHGGKAAPGMEDFLMYHGGKVAAEMEDFWSQSTHSQKAESEQEIGAAYEASRPSPSDVLTSAWLALKGSTTPANSRVGN